MRFQLNWQNRRQKWMQCTSHSEECMVPYTLQNVKFHETTMMIIRSTNIIRSRSITRREISDLYLFQVNGNMLNEEAAEAMLKAALQNERNCLLALEIDVSAVSLSICQPTSFSITRLYAGNVFWRKIKINTTGAKLKVLLWNSASD